MTERFPLPFNGPSSASKAALEVLADVYRGELKPFVIDSVLVEAGNMRTFMSPPLTLPGRPQFVCVS